jgi:hypothetical protein
MQPALYPALYHPARRMVTRFRGMAGEGLPYPLLR